MRAATSSFLRCALAGLLAAWLLAVPAGSALAQATARPLTTAPLPNEQSASVQLRQPAAATTRLDELRRQHEFRYAEPPPSQPSALALLWQHFLAWLSKLLEATSYHSFWRWVLYALLATAVVFVVLKLLQVDLTLAFGRSPRRAGELAYDTATENIHELDFAARLREAEDTGNYRLALRLGYLELLKQLSDQHLIDWQPDKTNHAYLREVATARPSARTAFSELTRQFEYVWYGELPLPAALYQRAREAQQQLGRQLGRPVAA